MMNHPVNMISLEEICCEPYVTKDIIITLVEEGIVAPEGNSMEKWVFDVTILHRVKKACRLHQELDIDWNAVAVVMALIEQLESERFENERLKQQLLRFMQGTK